MPVLLNDYQIATTVIEGANLLISVELIIHSLTHNKNNKIHIRVCKVVMGTTMFIKTCLFLAMKSGIPALQCNLTGRFAAILYHTSMVAGAIILLSRVQTVSPENWKQWTRYLGIFFILFRAAVGITDCVLVKISKTDYNVCVYVDETVWGSLYTFLDTTIDLYTTLMISTILITHIRRIHSIHAPANSSIYFAVLFHNVGRTFLLTIANLISAIFILSQINTDLIICLWTTTNFLFILLVGFDTDITRSIRVLQKKYTEISNKLGSDEGKPSLFSRAKNYIPGGSNELQPVPPAHVPTRYPNNIIELDTAVSQRHNPQSTDDSYNSNRNNYHNTPSHSLHS